MCDKRDERLPASNDVTGRVVQHPRTEKIEISNEEREKDGRFDWNWMIGLLDGQGGKVKPLLSR